MFALSAGPFNRLPNALCCQGSNNLMGVGLHGGVAGAVVSNNLFCKQQVAIGNQGGGATEIGHICCEGNVCRAVQREFQLPGGHHIVQRSADQSNGSGRPGKHAGVAQPHASGLVAACVPGLVSTLRRSTRTGN